MKRIVTIQDVSCFGKCSITVALPLVSAMGIECAIIPTSVLSTHTGGFDGFTFRDLSDDIPKISEHWQKYNIEFDTIYTGYLGSVKQIDYTIDFIRSFKKENTLLFVDPAMADNGELYAGFDSRIVEEMRKLCAVADVIVPNLTEAAFLLGEDYTPEEYGDRNRIRNILVRLTDLGIRQVPADIVEATRSFGATSSQLLYKVQLPLALPTIMTGVNQTIMLSLSMVVIAAMISAGGLGEIVLRGITQMKIGLGFEGGIAVVILAIILDRITQGLGKQKKGK